MKEDLKEIENKIMEFCKKYNCSIVKEDLKEIENKIMEFCKKYNCSIETHTLSDGRDKNGNIHILKVCAKIIT